MHRIAVITALLTSSGVLASARADPTTIGVEWEVKHQWIDLTELAGLERRDLVADVKTGKPLGTRLLCSTVTSPVDARWPVLSVTYDLRSRLTDRHIRQLEAVTGPLYYVGEDDDPEGLDDAARLLDAFYTAFEKRCEGRESLIGEIKTCAVSVGELLEDLPAFTSRCNAAPDLDLTPEQAKRVTVVIPRQLGSGQDGVTTPLGSLNEVIKAGLLGVNTQASLGFALALYGQPQHDLGALYERRDETEFKTEEGPSLAWLAYEHFRTSKATKLASLDDEQRGFLALYYIGLHAWTAYFLERSALQSQPVKLQSFISTYKFSHDDWPLKHGFVVLPKQNLGAIYKHLTSRKSFPASAFSPGGNNQAFFCDVDFGKIGPGERGSGHEQQLGAACQEMYATWEQAITGGKDPYALDILANEIESRFGEDGRLRVVFEMRRANTIVDGLSPFYMLGGLRFNWTGLPKALPARK